jgi:hypothetical protein
MRSRSVNAEVVRRALARHRAGVLAQIERSVDRRARAYRRAARKLFSRSELRALADISQQTRHRLQLANLKSGADGRQWAANRDAALARLQRELKRALPQYRAWQALAKEYVRDYRLLLREELAAFDRSDVHIDFGDVLPPHDGDFYEFTPPYSVEDSPVIDDEDVNVDDRSLTVAQQGYLVNRIHYAQEDDPLVITDIYGFNWFGRYTSTVACGVNFTTPAAGRLRIRATVQNFFSNIVVALRNEFGLSEGAISVDVRLVIDVIRPNETIELATTLLTSGYDSPGGAEATYQFPPIDNTMPQVFEATTEQTFAANTGLQILAGTQVFIFSQIDDMRAYADVNLGWQLQKMVVSVE